MGTFVDIHDYATFAKLYPARFPVPQHGNYYLSRLLCAVERPELPLAYPWLPRALRDFAELEAETGMLPLGDVVHKFRTKLAQDLAARTVSDHMDPATGFTQKDTVGNFAGRVLGRIDLVSANYSALRKYNSSLPSWDDFCGEHGVPTAIARSKSFRQSVLGLLNPKWQQRVQARAIQGVIDLTAKFLPSFQNRIVRCSPDEVVFTVEDSRAERWLFDQIAKGCAAERMPARFELFTLRRLSFAKAFTWTNLNSTTLAPVSVQPFMVPGNRFYIWLTRVVYGNEVTDTRDATYLDDGNETRWAYDYNRGAAHTDGL